MAAVDSSRFAGKVAVVTGGSRGIGAAVATRLAAEGAAVVIGYRGNRQAAEELVAALAGDGRRPPAACGRSCRRRRRRRRVLRGQVHTVEAQLAPTTKSPTARRA
ncbi:SDR family NAD(P)-dependent oxidoreductase [Kitasatospora sp. NPDC056531]|uniref:SDR family NAD(P)-dependent oxidoreductase n=1 Tax=Kitasatospora sp. NPDC056531 TaxID=3345856 RepID=UPI0036D01B78